ncbi:MAG: hypothetical protein HY259_14440 [Chloroflexi bacterium]|nr:hypothetical protein [Chloroflexota bacterium]MBI3734633.1 hypothetical protein [Chloroflexota bacterium]
MPSDKEAECRLVIDTARERGLYLRLLGGLAVKLRCPSATYRTLSRGYADVDYVGYHKQAIEIKRLFQDLGYVGNKRFNALQGRKRLMFAHLEKDCDVDIFLDVFEMCHKMNFANRLELDDYTIPLADLLMSKLQVVQINDKDIKDIFSILHDHPVVSGADKDGIDLRHLVKVAADDWGWHMTMRSTIDKCLSLSDNYVVENSKDNVAGKLRQIKQAIDEAPKTARWKLRAQVGERVRWYELPEDMGAVKAAGRDEAAEAGKPQTG